jgi:hypothetical protein
MSLANRSDDFELRLIASKSKEVSKKAGVDDNNIRALLQARTCNQLLRHPSLRGRRMVSSGEIPGARDGNMR